MLYLGPPQKNNLYQAVSRNVLYPDVIVGTSPWPWDLLCLSHTTPPRSCQLDKAWERPDWRQAQRQCHERMSRYPLGNSMHIESETLYGIVLSVEECVGLRTVGLRRSDPAYYHSQWPNLQSSPPTVISDSSTEQVVHTEDSLPWRAQHWSNWTTYGFYLTLWAPGSPPNKPSVLWTPAQCLLPRKSLWQYLTCLHSVAIEISGIYLGFF